MSEPITVTYPSWHDDARKRRQAGESTVKLADDFGVSASRISQVTSPSWQLYQIMGNFSKGKQDRSIGAMAAKLKEGNYRFVPVPTDPPSKTEAAKKANPKPRHMEVEDVSRLREFKVVKKPYEGKMLVGARIECSTCDNSEEYFNYKGSVTPAHLPKEFERRGWLVGKNERTDRCPECVAKMRGVKPKPAESFAPVPIVEGIATIPQSGIPSLSPVLKEVPMPQVLPAMIQPSPAPASKKARWTWEMPSKPLMTVTNEGNDGIKNIPPAEIDRKMTRADDQIIYLNLMDVYVDERSGYKDDWTDIKVAANLNVPVEWVALVRDRSFGPETNAALRDKQGKALADKAGEIERLIVIADKKMEALQNLDNKVTDIMSQIDTAIDRYEQLVKSLETEDKHVENIVAQFDKTVKEYREMAASGTPLPLAS